jgi:hypothetical protein
MSRTVAVEARPQPVHSIFAEPRQVRVKVQGYSSLPPEITIRQVDHSREVERVFDAYHRDLAERPWNAGGEITLRPPAKKPRDPDAAPNPENLQRSMVRRKSKLRQTIKELAPNAFITLTSRRLLTSLDLAGAAYAEWLRLVRKHYGDAFACVWVPEWHGGSDHLHLHIAARVPGGMRAACTALRFFWHIALCRITGRPRPSAILRDSESPGNIDIDNRGLRGKSDLVRVNKIARYMSKYLTKDMVLEFGRKAYSPTKNIELAAAVVFWCTELDLNAARDEALRRAGYDPLAALTAAEFAPIGSGLIWMEMAHSPGSG